MMAIIAIISTNQGGNAGAFPPALTGTKNQYPMKHMRHEELQKKQESPYNNSNMSILATVLENQRIQYQTQVEERFQINQLDLFNYSVPNIYHFILYDNVYNCLCLVTEPEDIEYLQKQDRVPNFIFGACAIYYANL